MLAADDWRSRAAVNLSVTGAEGAWMASIRVPPELCEAP